MFIIKKLPYFIAGYGIALYDRKYQKTLIFFDSYSDMMNQGKDKLE